MSRTPRTEKEQIKKQKSADITATMDSLKKLSEKASINIKIDEFEKTDESNNEVYA